MATVTPMMQQYLLLKEQYKDTILLYRLGDFYEMFFDDAILASRELEITLTGKDCGLEERAPMCGVPFHAVDGYIHKLIDKGYKVAICEQLTNPSTTKGLVERDVVRVITRGTITEGSMLDETKNNFLTSLYKDELNIGVASVDVTTGEFYMAEFKDNIVFDRLKNELTRIRPMELIANEELAMTSEIVKFINKNHGIILNCYHGWAYKYETAYQKLIKHFKVADLEGIGCSSMPFSICAAGALLEYLYETQKIELNHINHIRIQRQEDHMLLDITTRRNLELIETMRTKSKKGSLLWLLDKTVTAMGGRMIRMWVEQPLNQLDEIQNRLQAVEEMKDKVLLNENIGDCLKKVYDIERLTSRISYGTLNARDCIALKQSVSVIPVLRKLLIDVSALKLKHILQNIDSLEDIFILLNQAISEDCPVGIKDGGIIKEGYNEKLDKIKKATTEGKNWISALEADERKNTGIKNLKISYNRIFGYYIEITKSYLQLVPLHYTRKQTLANAERYVTEELKQMEETILGAEEKSIQMEYEIFCEIREVLNNEIIRLQKTAHALAQIDALRSFAVVATLNHYVKPIVHNGDEIEIIAGRHPVVEKSIPNDMFVSNHTTLNLSENRIAIITGPNMAGKSTYMRQVAIITLMAHIGCFVPAKSAKICLVDRIFTRVGASDDLSSGQSTFMVEMSEVANILHNATPNSLLILDEIGRGTSTFDGLSIAWAVIEFICNPDKIGAKTLFATHYHELTELEGRLPSVKNYCISVKEHGEDIIFLRKIIRGSADKSFGIQVAKLAGLPQEVIDRAKIILEKLEAADINKSKLDDSLHDVMDVALEPSKNNEYLQKEKQLNLFNPQIAEVLHEVLKLDVMKMMPIEALNILYDLQNRIKSL